MFNERELLQEPVIEIHELHVVPLLDDALEFLQQPAVGIHEFDVNPLLEDDVSFSLSLSGGYPDGVSLCDGDDIVLVSTSTILSRLLQAIKECRAGYVDVRLSNKVFGSLHVGDATSVKNHQIYLSWERFLRQLLGDMYVGHACVSVSEDFFVTVFCRWSFSPERMRKKMPPAVEISCTGTYASQLRGRNGGSLNRTCGSRKCNCLDMCLGVMRDVCQRRGQQIRVMKDTARYFCFLRVAIRDLYLVYVCKIGGIDPFSRKEIDEENFFALFGEGLVYRVPYDEFEVLLTMTKSRVRTLSLFLACACLVLGFCEDKEYSELMEKAFNGSGKATGDDVFESLRIRGFMNGDAMQKLRSEFSLERVMELLRQDGMQQAEFGFGDVSEPEDLEKQFSVVVLQALWYYDEAIAKNPGGKSCSQCSDVDGGEEKHLQNKRELAEVYAAVEGVGAPPLDCQLEFPNEKKARSDDSGVFGSVSTIGEDGAFSVAPDGRVITVDGKSATYWKCEIDAMSEAWKGGQGQQGQTELLDLARHTVNLWCGIEAKAGSLDVDSVLLENLKHFFQRFACSLQCSTAKIGC